MCFPFDVKLYLDWKFSDEISSMYNFNPSDLRDLDLWFSKGDFDIIIMLISFPNDHK